MCFVGHVYDISIRWVTKRPMVETIGYKVIRAYGTRIFLGHLEVGEVALFGSLVLALCPLLIANGSSTPSPLHVGSNSPHGHSPFRWLACGRRRLWVR